MGKLEFALTSFWFGLRDLFSPPGEALHEAGIHPGDRVLDYGCGPGSYALATATMVGPSGHVYAADINPLALQHLTLLAARRGLRNVSAIETDCATGLADGHVDVVLLYDALHDLAEPERVLSELHRVLRPGGALSLSDHHLLEGEILARVTGSGLFGLAERGKKTYHFVKPETR